MAFTQKYFALGHITDDVTVSPDNNDSNHYPGGSVSYAAYTAKKLGFKAHIITKCNPQHAYIKKLEEMGIRVHCLPNKDNSKRGPITSFVNTYDNNGHRTQMVDGIQETITTEDLKEIRKIISEDSIIHIAPVINEIDPQLIPPLSKIGFLVVTPQGYFRERQRDGTVSKITWKNISICAQTNIVILSTEDMTFSGGLSRSVLAQLRRNAPIFILTKQEKGSIIFRRGNEVLNIKAFQLNADEEKDFTGTGDVFAASFVIHFQKFNDLKSAGVFACLWAAIKIMGYNGRKKGVLSVPGIEILKQFINQNPERVSDFLAQNSSTQSPLQGDPLQMIM